MSLPKNYLKTSIYCVGHLDPNCMPTMDSSYTTLSEAKKAYDLACVRYDRVKLDKVTVQGTPRGVACAFKVIGSASTYDNIKVSLKTTVEPHNRDYVSDVTVKTLFQQEGAMA